MLSGSWWHWSSRPGGGLQRRHGSFRVGGSCDRPSDCCFAPFFVSRVASSSDCDLHLTSSSSSACGSHLQLPWDFVVCSFLFLRFFLDSGVCFFRGVIEVLRRLLFFSAFSCLGVIGVCALQLSLGAFHWLFGTLSHGWRVEASFPASILSARLLFLLEQSCLASPSCDVCIAPPSSASGNRLSILSSLYLFAHFSLLSY